MNTEQAFNLLRDAGVTEDLCIQTVRRWLRERKINYEGTGLRKTGYILDDTDQAFDMLKDAGVSESIGVQIVRRWLREGKIQDVGTGNRKPEYIPTETTKKQTSINLIDQDKIIRQLKIRIKAQDEHIKGMEKLHQTSINTLIQQRNKLKIEIAQLEKENRNLQSETKKLLEENLALRNELLKMKEELNRGINRDSEDALSPHKTYDNRHKLGLAKTASDKEVLAGYKKLLKLTHPDHGGNARAFHYIKMDYDDFRKCIKE